MAKQISMELEEYNKELLIASEKGFQNAFIVVKDLLDTGGTNITIDQTKVTAEFLKLVEQLKDIHGKLKSITPAIGN